MAGTQVNLYEAKTQLSNLVDRAAKGEEIIIAKAGKPLARLTAANPPTKPMRKFGQNVMGISFHAPDWDKDIPLDYFRDEDGPSRFEAKARKGVKK